jgi:probable HAF family extracellular repeat protein
LLPDNSDFHAALWPDVNSIVDLGTLPAPLNYASLALGINDAGQVVGTSFDATLTNSSAFLWENGVMSDLNTLVKGSSNLTLIWAASINDRGEIVGFGASNTGEIHGYLAIPSKRDRDDR